MTLKEKVIELAKQSVGVTETSTNWSYWIKIYLKCVAIFAPAPWCAAFVAYKIHQAAGQLKTKSIWPKSGYVQTVVNWAKKQNLVFRDPQQNAIFAVWNVGLNRYAHIGFIADVRKSIDGKQTEILTIEGNSNTDGGREGKTVVSVWRVWNRSKHICIIIK